MVNEKYIKKLRERIKQLKKMLHSADFTLYTKTKELEHLKEFRKTHW